MQCLQIDLSVSLDFAWSELEKLGATIAYSEEDFEKKQLHIFEFDEKALLSLKWIKEVTIYIPAEINWNDQWQLHGANFKGGVPHIDLSPFSSPSILKLQPGPGFGDLSHPTTYLTLKLMARYLAKQPVIDVGCGSGIIALTALLLGASFAYGIDIDPNAITHARSNAALNQLEANSLFCLPTCFKMDPSTREALICINIISSDQEIAWQTLSILHTTFAKVITSGIMVEERAFYLKQARNRGWQLIEEEEKEGWLAFCFQQLAS